MISTTAVDTAKPTKPNIKLQQPAARSAGARSRAHRRWLAAAARAVGRGAWGRRKEQQPVCGFVVFSSRRSRFDRQQVLAHYPIARTFFTPIAFTRIRSFVPKRSRFNLWRKHQA